MYRIGTIGLSIALIIMVICALLYVWSSRQNPNVIDIVGSSILISLLLGSSSTFFVKMFEKTKKRNSSAAKWFLISVSILITLIAFLIYSSNAPESIRQEIPITYIFNRKAKEIAWNLDTPSDESDQNYFLALQLFRYFRDRSMSNSEVIDDMMKLHGQENISSNLGIFHELTEYLLAWNIGHIFTTGDMELAMLRGQSRNWLAFPKKEIEIMSKGKDVIKGDFESNIFYDYNDQDPISKSWDFRLPRNTNIIMTKNDGWHSKIIITDDSFFTVELEVHGLLVDCGAPTLVHESAFGVFGDTDGPFKKYKCLLICNASFNKWKYGFPKMRHYEQWVSDLFSKLQRRFAWGSPPLININEMIKRQERQKIQGEQRQSHN
ncbi:MAG: hypothetical protein JRJ38_07055 [Deltaproteobacteria bacterium]|nr:hypothetical protein [Deltaproteobacteria bacterium]